MDPLQTEAVARVAPLHKFRSTNEQGQVVESAKPLGTTIINDTKYYYCAIPNGSMHRPDGVRIGFVSHMFETNVLETQRYIDAEIADQHPYVREATADEVEAMKMKRDPRGTITSQVSDDIERKLRAEFEEEITKILNAPPGSAMASNLDDEKIKGISALRDRLAHKEVVKSGTASVIMEAQVPALRGIVTTRDIQDGAAGSGGNGTGAAPAGSTKK